MLHLSTRLSANRYQCTLQPYLFIRLPFWNLCQVQMALVFINVQGSFSGAFGQPNRVIYVSCSFSPGIHRSRRTGNLCLTSGGSMVGPERGIQNLRSPLLAEAGCDLTMLRYSPDGWRRHTRWAKSVCQELFRGRCLILGCRSVLASLAGTRPGQARAGGRAGPAEVQVGRTHLSAVLPAVLWPSLLDGAQERPRLEPGSLARACAVEYRCAASGRTGSLAARLIQARRGE